MQRLGMQNMQNLGGPKRKRHLSYLLSDGATLGPEKLTNPSFDVNTTGWSPNRATAASVSGGQSGNCAELTRVSGVDQVISATVATTVGSRYQSTSYIKSGTSGDESGGLKVQRGTDFTTIISSLITSSGIFTILTCEWEADVSSTLIVLVKNTATSGTMLFDTASVKEIIPVWVNG